MMLLIIPSLVSLVLLNGGCAAAQATNATFPAVLVFGDSIVDPGNNNYINTIAKCNFPPYGRDFPGGIATGRFSNGKVPSDFTAEIFGIKELVPAYLDPNLQLQDLLTGVSFASGAAGYDPLSAQLASALPLSDQLQMFKEYKGKISAAIGEVQADALISKSAFLFCCGSNDITNTYPIRRAHYDIDSYTDLTVHYASQFYQELYNLGARRVAILGLPIIGCVPSQRTVGGGILRECDEDENIAASLYNSKLSALAGYLKKSLPGYNIEYFDVYNPLRIIIQNYRTYGFEEVTKGCCATGKIEATALCNKFSDVLSCKDASKFVFWDAFHPTEKAYRILTSMILKPGMKKLL